MKKTPLDILIKGTREEKLALFLFTLEENNDIILVRFNLWARYFFPKYFEKKDAKFHEEIDRNNLNAYKGNINSFTNIAFRGSGKTTRTKLFLAFAILNDKNHFRRYIKILTKDITNSKQSVTDIYNMFINEKIQEYYPETFQKTDQKREETMRTFTTSFVVKVLAGTVGTEHRGALQEEARPDFIWFDDFETRKTLRSIVETHTVWDNMQEAITSLPTNGTGSCIYTCNYLSERGNVHKLVEKENDNNTILIVPIIDKKEKPTWFHDVKYIKQLKLDADDFEGEYLCEPSTSRDILFDREIINDMKILVPEQSISGFRMYKKYDASCRYASGVDVASGVGLDSSTNVIINFSSTPAMVVATYNDNTITPDIFGDELKRQNEYYDLCYIAVEKNNHGHATIGRLKQIYPLWKIHETQKNYTRIETIKEQRAKEYGWHTNGETKSKMIFDLVNAVNKGWLILNCPKLIAEARSYTRNDFMDTEADPRLSTRHFDLLISCAIAYQMKDFCDISEVKRKKQDDIQRIIDNANFDPFEVV